MSLFIELKRRNVFRVGAAYLVVSWLLIQIVVAIETPLRLPGWFDTSIIVLLALGFPVALLIAWAFELTPDGIKPTRAVNPEESITQQTGQKLNRFVTITLALALLLVVTDSYVLTPDKPAAAVEVEVEGTTVVSETLPATSPAEKSIAVLPFANLSSDAEQEYFSDGLSEELLNRLAKISNLQVAGRTSSFYYKGRNEDLREIGSTLGVTYILEGSVRKSGNKIRITAQLIKAGDGFHLWSKTFDRELTEIFAIQDEIAGAVTTALSVTLGAGEFDREGMTHNIMAYDAYLQGKAANNTFTPTAMQNAIEYYQEAVKLDPEFALAWIQLGRLYDDAQATMDKESLGQYVQFATQALERGRELAPTMLEARLYSVNNQRNNINWKALGEDLEPLIELYAESNAEVNLEYGLFLRNLGRMTDALPYLRRAKRLDPFNVEASYFLASCLFNLNRTEEARGEADYVIEIGDWDDQVAFMLMQDIFLNHGDLAEAVVYSEKSVENLVKAFNGVYPSYWDKNFFPAVLLQNSEFEKIKDHLTNAEKNPDMPSMIGGGLALYASTINEPELALHLMQNQDGSLDFNYPHLWNGIHGPVRQLEEFKQILMAEGLVDYWRSSGKWPDMCRPLEGNDDFECI